MSGFDPRMVAQTYSAIAEDYALTYAERIDRVDLDRRLLDGLAGRVGGGAAGAAAAAAGADARVLDVGCGPAQVGRYLADRGCAVVGVDAAAGMLAVARRRNPDLGLVGADMRALPVRSGSCGGLVSFYLLHHLPRAELRSTLREFRRVLAAGAPLLLATHAGVGVFSTEGVDGAEITGTLYTEDEVGRALTAERFRLEAVDHRDPLPHERQADRIYVTATAG